MRSGPSSRRASATGRSSSPTCTPSAPAARATSPRSFTTTGTPAGFASATRRRAVATRARPALSLSRSCSAVAPPATAACATSSWLRPRKPAWVITYTRRSNRIRLHLLGPDPCTQVAGLDLRQAV